MSPWPEKKSKFNLKFTYITVWQSWNRQISYIRWDKCPEVKQGPFLRDLLKGSRFWGERAGMWLRVSRSGGEAQGPPSTACHSGLHDCGLSRLPCRALTHALQKMIIIATWIPESMLGVEQDKHVTTLCKPLNAILISPVANRISPKLGQSHWNHMLSTACSCQGLCTWPKA